ncbi:MAG: tRNA 4-thiouridine(8) synthase ThiI, partial [Candidatus Nanohalobium sp.]
ASVKKLNKFNPSKTWNAYVVDMEEVNRELAEIGRGRMVVHRRIMFKVAERIAEEEGLNGLVTGESLGQKSSQTNWNMEMTSEAVDKPLLRPLLTEDKNSITDEAREIGTFEEAEINSACRSLSPEQPATKLKQEDLERLEEEVDFEALVDKALNSRRQIEL